jgi:serine protease Do
MAKGKLLRLCTNGIMMILMLALHVTLSGCDNKAKTEFVGFPRSFADLAEKVRPAVVNISTTSTVTVPGTPFHQFFGHDQGGEFDDFFKNFFGQIPDRKMKQQSLGSGFIINKEGDILTNNHVVDNSEEIKVRLSDGREFKAKVIGRDTKTDLALIKISSAFENLPVLTLGDSEKMRVGDWVMAVGNPFGLEHTVTQGIISATGRVIGSGPYDDFLQTDAPINPGNSGGPLVNLKGEVIGINTAITAGGQGIGFSIPSALAKSIATQLKEKGKVVRGWIGAGVQTVTPELAQSFGMKEAKGALVSEVIKNGPAEKGGMKTGDIIISFDGKTVTTSNDLPRLVAETPAGKTADVVVVRDKKEVHLSVKVEELNEAKIAAQSSAPVQSLGMKVDNVTPQLQQQFGTGKKTGVVVVSVEQGSLAEEAGIQKGDVIKQVNRKTVRNLAEFNAAMGQRRSDQLLLLLLKRGKQAFFVTLQER